MGEERGRIEASIDVLDAQRAILRTVSGGVGSFGIYAGDPQPASAVLEDLRLLARLGRAGLRLDEEHAFRTLGDELAGGFLSLKGSQAERRELQPRSSVLVAAGNAAAFRALQNKQDVASLLGRRLPKTMSTVAYSQQLTELIDASLGRRRRPTAILRARHLGAVVDPAERAAKLPALLWPEWTSRLAPNRMDPEVASGALSAAVVMVGTDLTQGAALQMLDPTAPSRRLTHVMGTLGQSRHESETLVALTKLAEYLDRGPIVIDYKRRRGLDYADLLPETQWKQICERLNLIPGQGRRWRAARMSLFLRLSGNRADTSPASIAVLSAAERVLSRRLLGTAPQALTDALLQVASDFLAERAIDEAVDFVPPLSVAGIAPNPVEASVGEEWEWHPARPGARQLEASFPAQALTDAYASGRSAREIAVIAQVGKQTVARALDRATVTARRQGRPSRSDIDDNWLRDRYLNAKMTMPELAAEVGCSVTTVSSRLSRLGVDMRARGSGSRAEVMRPHERAGDSPLLQRVLQGQDAIERARRFLVVVDQPTLGAAAAQIGVSQATLGVQMKRLAADAGERLFSRAERGRPMSLTKPGAELLQELKRALLDE